jgi:hypothetical protein
MKNIDEWVEWMIRNPELAEKYYPELMQGLTDLIKEIEPFLTALIIQKLPDHFPKWKTEANQYFGIKRTKMIQGYIDLIKAVLFEYEYPSEIEQQAFESVRPELTEQLEYWNNELKKLPHQPTIKQNNKLSDLITHQKSIEIVEGIKIQYKNIKGKRLKLLLLALQDLELLPKERISQKFFNSCKYEFDWDIASYNAMNMYKYNDITDRDEFNSMKQFLKTLIKTE